MAYAAVTRLYRTIHHLLNSSRISVAFSTQTILRSAGQGAKRLQKTLQKYDEIKNSSEGVMGVDAKIRDEAQKLEDAIESQASALFLSQSQSHGRVSLNLDHLRHVIDCFLATAEKMRQEYMEELYKPSSPVAVSPTSESVGNYCDMVGSSDVFLGIRNLMLDYSSESDEPLALTISGMAGIGKTILARKVFHDSSVKEKFECRAFVRVGLKYQVEDILRAILAQLNVKMIVEGDGNIQEYFKRNLRGRKFLFVFDDVWDLSNFLTSFEIFLPESCRGSFYLVTSRFKSAIFSFQMPYLNEEESWELLRREVFGEGDCPPQLVKAGKKIAQNCEGLPLLILTVAKHLSDENPKYWKKVAEMKTSVFDDACDQIYEGLLPSYHFMTQNEKACFLYMAVFPNNDAVRSSRITNFWRAEAFADRLRSAFRCIIFSNLVVVSQENVGLWLEDGDEDKVKACNLHIVYRYLCKREGENIKFMCILNRYAAGMVERIKGMRRVAIHHNTLLAIKEVHNSIASVSSLRSVVCSGPYHQYQVPICLELKLLRVLDALSIRFYEFPAEVVKLIQLKYLSLTTNANLPPSIHKLWFLQFLIVHQHLSINRLGVPEKYMPVEIWELQELQHLQIIGRNLPHPPPVVILPNLTHLLDVGVQTCGKGVLESIPNLEKLRIQIESAPNAAHTITCFDHISCLENLRSLQCVIRNPIATVPSQLLSDCFTSRCHCLTKLTLSGCGYPWTDMSKIAKLPRLKALKLQCYAFRGEKWVANEMRFKLSHLLIEDTDLAQWTAVDETFSFLYLLTMKNCHKLQEIPQLRTSCKIALVDCNPLAETSAKQDVDRNVEVSCSWK